MTKFRALLEYLNEIDVEARQEAILEYFDKEDENEFIIDECTYYVYDYEEVKGMLAEQYKEEAEEFERSLRASDFQHMVRLIDYDSIVSELLYDLEYDEVRFLAFLDKVHDYYIYQDE